MPTTKRIKETSATINIVHNRRILRLVLSVAGLVLFLSVLNVRKCNLITVLVKWQQPDIGYF